MSQWLKVIAALAEDQSSVPIPMLGNSQPPVDPASGDLTLSSDLTCTPMCTHKQLTKSQNFKFHECESGLRGRNRKAYEQAWS